MLQQTRAAAAIPFYEGFLAKFPTPQALAAASESEVLAAWAGLGYYSRARNVHKTAKVIAERGRFPRTIDRIRELPGIGPYTAAAVASIAFGLPHAVLDGNVLRVLARLFNDPADIASSTTKARFQARADDLLDPARPGVFNQAMMELGATVCLPRNPTCLVCPVASLCEARAAGTAAGLPVKLRKGAPERVETHLLIFERDDSVLLYERPPDARRMPGFWELPARDQFDTAPAHRLGEFRHTIVNQCFDVSVSAAKWPGGRAPLGYKWWKPEELRDVPLTTMTRKALRMRKS